MKHMIWLGLSRWTYNVWIIACLGKSKGVEKREHTRQGRWGKGEGDGEAGVSIPYNLYLHPFILSISSFLWWEIFQTCQFRSKPLCLVLLSSLFSIRWLVFLQPLIWSDSTTKKRKEKKKKCKQIKQANCLFLIFFSYFIIGRCILCPCIFSPFNFWWLDRLIESLFNLVVWILSILSASHCSND